MIKNIVLFMPVQSQYGVLHHFTVKFYEALMRAGVNCRILTAEKENPRPFLTQLFNDPPDCTLSFNGVLPDEENRFLCDLIKIPHICCLVDSPLQFLPLVKSPYNIITCVDRSYCEFFKKMHHNNTLFLPHAVEKSLTYYPNSPRTYDVLMPGSCIDYEAIANTWKSKYPKELVNALYEAAEITFADQEKSYVDALALTVDALSKKHPEVDIKAFDFISILDELETYVVGFERIRVIKSIKDAQVHIVGHSKSKWEHYLGKQSNCVIHDPVPFEEALGLMRQAKIVLNSFIAIKAGAHERVLTGLALGAAVFTRENQFLKETFKNGENIAFYSGQSIDSINDRVNELLQNENKRAEIAQKGHDTVLHHHTWDQRADTLLKALPTLLESVPC
ncbi:MAG: glycosyltransferase family protein [Parachlamydiaceae bacterium]